MTIRVLPVLLFLDLARDLEGIVLCVDMMSNVSLSELSTTGLFCLLPGGAMYRFQGLNAHDVPSGDSNPGSAFLGAGVNNAVE